MEELFHNLIVENAEVQDVLRLMQGINEIKGHFVYRPHFICKELDNFIDRMWFYYVR